MSDQELILRDPLGNIVAKASTTKPIEFYGSSRITSKESIENIFQGTHWGEQNFDSITTTPFSWGNVETTGVLKLNVDEIKTWKVMQSITVNVVLEKYEDPILEVNSDNEVVIKVGKLKIGGCK